MQGPAALLAALDALFADIDDVSYPLSPVLSMKSSARGGNEGLHAAVFMGEGRRRTARAPLADKSSDCNTLRARPRPSLKPFALSPRPVARTDGAGVASSCSTFSRPTRPRSILMKELPLIPSMSSPILPAYLINPPSPSSTLPDLTWHPSQASSSLPASPRTPGFLFPACASSSLHAADSPSMVSRSDVVANTTADSEQLNHPYIPWSPSLHSQIFGPRAVRQRLSISSSRYSRPPSRSGARAPEPSEEEQEILRPGCWNNGNGTGRWRKMTGAVKRNVGRVKKKFKLRVRGPSAAMGPPVRTSRMAVQRTSIIRPRSIDRASRPRSGIYSRPLSIASVDSASVQAWLDARRRASFDNKVIAEPPLTLDEYERRGSWLEQLHERVCEEDDTVREAAILAGWACGRVGCAMHPRVDWSPPLAPSRRAFERPLARSRARNSADEVDAGSPFSQRAWTRAASSLTPAMYSTPHMRPQWNENDWTPRAI